MQYFDIVEKFVEVSREESDGWSLAQSFERATAKMGVKHFACVSHVDWRVLPRGAVALTNYPAGWIVHFLRCDLHRVDPVCQRAESDLSPFFWHDSDWRGGMGPAQLRVFDEARCWGIEYGLTVPLHLAGAPNASCSFVFENAEVDPNCVHALHLMAAYLYESGRRLDPELVLLTLPSGLPVYIRESVFNPSTSVDPWLARIRARQSD